MSLAGPSYQALTVELVDREDLANAIALNSTQFQLSRVLGPALAGFALSAFGVAGCFFANAVSYIAVIAALALVKFKPRDAGRIKMGPVGGREGFWRELTEGLRYVWGRPRVFWLLMISGFTSFFGAPYITMLPVFARDIFHLDDRGLATMMAVAGGGAFIGALILAFLGDFRRKGFAVLGGAFSFALCLIAFSLSTNLTLALIFLFAMGFSIVFSVAVINTLLQQLVTDQMRGRVMSIFILSFIGAMPFGNLIAGSASNRYGAPKTLAAGGVVIAIFVATLAVRNRSLREL
jgi:predicted MFS family arabinose efflux permease